VPPLRLLVTAALLAIGWCCVAAAAVPQPPPSVSPGGLFLLRIDAGDPVPAAVEFLGKSYPPLRRGDPREPFFLLGLDIDAPVGPQPLVLRFPDGSERRLATTVAPRSFPEERLTLPQAMVTPPPELAARIAREQEQAAAVYRSSAGTQLWSGGFVRAVDGPASGNFGKRRILNGLPRSPHAGQDYTAPAGTPVRAVGGGVVRLCGDFYFSGLTVLVDHGAGLVSQYLHLERIDVKEGDTVAAGAIVGRVGSTGRATGPHLHLGLRLFEQRVDPELLWGLFLPEE
jgi:murein DD-endopeptidase MepM/ murein hydrolase activator NlpD